MWFVLLQPQVGVLPDLVPRAHPGVKKPGLLQDPGTALPAVAVSSIWASLGFTFIVVTAGCRASRASCTRARTSTAPAAGRGSPTSRCRCSRPTLLFTTVVLTTRAFQAYGEVDLLTQGGPNPERPTES